VVPGHDSFGQISILVSEFVLFLPPSLERPPDSSAFVEAGNAESLIQLSSPKSSMRSPTGVHSEAFRRYYLQPVKSADTASPQERFQALDALVQRHPDLGKRLLIALLPGHRARILHRYETHRMHNASA